MAGTNVLSIADAKIEFSINCQDVTPTWTDYGCQVAEVSVSGGERVTSDAFAFCADSPYTVVGRKNPFDVEATLLYTEDAAEAWKILFDEFQTVAGSCDIGIRWSPKGGNAGDFRFTACGVLTNVELPDGAADSGDAITTAVVIRAGQVTLDVIP